MPAICAVKKEVYIPSPEKRVTPTASISYIGEGLRREEVRTFVRSSDWSGTVRPRRSSFSFLENRETDEMEMYPVRIAEKGDGEDIWTTSCFRYTLTF